MGQGFVVLSEILPLPGQHLSFGRRHDGDPTVFFVVFEKVGQFDAERGSNSAEGCDGRTAEAAFNLGKVARGKASAHGEHIQGDRTRFAEIANFSTEFFSQHGLVCPIRENKFSFEENLFFRTGV